MATRATPPVTPQPNLKGILDRLGSGSVRLRAATGYADIFGRTAIDLAANADFAGGQWVPLDRTQPSVLLQVIPGSGLVLYTAPAAPAGPVPWAGPYTIGQAPTVDANGWRVAYQGDGKRRWRKRHLGIGLPAATLAAIVGDLLPAGVANMGALDFFVSWRGASSSLPLIVCATTGTDASTTLNIYAATTDGSNLSAKVATLDVFIEAVER